ncbi:uncharacterized protein A4U43_C01F34130 [Asparagus officinalis]|uniref:Uncharacterized protein n=1 Tax=Asparagus officinalis TaxID=4686 RepID=A0A5P1FU89_ASPOF|nr:uncharacterized protein A4U43_C01F34130 [Asparagus officinalis]
MALVQLDIRPESKINLTLKRISHQSSNPSGHEEVPSTAHHRYIPGFVHKRVGARKADAPSMLRRVEKRKRPSVKTFLLCATRHPLGLFDGRGEGGCCPGDGVRRNTTTSQSGWRLADSWLAVGHAGARLLWPRWRCPRSRLLG